MAPIDLISSLVSDELTRRSERLLDRRRKQAAFRDPHKSLDNFDFNFNPEMNRSLVFDLATGAFIGKREDALFSAQANRCPRITPDNAICYYSPFP
jgi:DNA replication protein DnaC